MTTTCQSRARIGAYTSAVSMRLQKPWRIRNGAQGRQHRLPAIIHAFHDALLSQHGFHRRHVGIFKAKCAG